MGRRRWCRFEPGGPIVRAMRLYFDPVDNASLRFSRITFGNLMFVAVGTSRTAGSGTRQSNTIALGPVHTACVHRVVGKRAIFEQVLELAAVERVVEYRRESSGHLWAVCPFVYRRRPGA